MSGWEAVRFLVYHFWGYRMKFFFQDEQLFRPRLRLRTYIILHIGMHEQECHFSHFVADTHCVLLTKMNRNFFTENLVVHIFH